MGNACGIPTFSEYNLTAFTVGNELIILSKNNLIFQRFYLGNYANLAPISPDGQFVVFNDMDDQFWSIRLTDGNRTKLTQGPDGYFMPTWSPDSKKIAAYSLTGFVFIFEIESGRVFKLGKGSSVSWFENSQRLIFCEQKWNNKYEIVSSVPVVMDFDGKNKQPLLPERQQNVRFLHLSPKANKLVYIDQNQLVISDIDISSKKVSVLRSQHVEINLTDLFEANAGETNELNDELSMMDSYSFSAPYLHQVYDTPNWFNGHWACGATSAMMALKYYNVLPDWSCNCSAPYSHVSTHGRYICEVYEFNGFTYNIGGYDPNSNLGYGGYGYIIQDNWADTKGNMAKYARQHGLGSSVDWYPSYSKFMADINEEFPVVILNSLTSSGHYILGVGYNSGQHSVVVNDPYGNKNQGYMNYNGKNVIYDWPGYNSGHSNLNIVHCLINMRNGCDLNISTFSLPDTVFLGENVPLSFQVYNRGGRRSDSTSVRLYLSSDQNFNGDDPELKNISIAEIDSNDSLLLNTEVAIPDSLHSARWALGIRVDEENRLMENLETNNLTYTVCIIKGYPRVYRERPTPNSSISDPRSEISARFLDDYCGVITDSIKFYLDQIEVTEQCAFDGNKIYFIPENDLSPAVHSAKIEVLNGLGYRTSSSWDFELTLTVVQEDDASRVDSEYSLSQNYPNPFNGSTKIKYNIAEPGIVSLKIFAINGQLTRTLVNEFRNKGEYTCVWDGRDQFDRPVSSGIYLYQFQINNISKTLRTVYLR